MMASLIEHGIRSPAVLHAMAGVPREEFVLEEDREHAYADRALPIDAPGQTISQPLMVAAVVEALELHAGDRALDVGTGSGYQAAVMAACGAHVVSIERVSSLARSAAERLRRLDFDVEVVEGDGTLGVPERAPFDAIAVGAAAPRLPVALARQLVEGGRLVVPITDGTDGEQLTRLRLVGGRWVDRIARPVPLRAADRRRRVSGSGAGLTALGDRRARRNPEHPDPRRTARTLHGLRRRIAERRRQHDPDLLVSRRAVELGSRERHRVLIDAVRPVRVAGAGDADPQPELAQIELVASWGAERVGVEVSPRRRGGAGRRSCSSIGRESSIPLRLACRPREVFDKGVP